MSVFNGFIRSKLKEPAKLQELLSKVSGIKAKKKNAFNVEYNGTRFFGEFMTASDLTTDPTKVTFSYAGTNYSFLLSNIKIVKRLRSRKYMFEVKVLTVVP